VTAEQRWRDRRASDGRTNVDLEDNPPARRLIDIWSLPFRVGQRHPSTSVERWRSDCSDRVAERDDAGVEMLVEWKRR